MERMIEQQAVIDCLTNTAKYYDMPQADEWTKGIHYGLLHGIDNILDNVKPVEAIPKADYEKRLKADMISMLTELKKEIDAAPINPNGSESFKLGQATAFDRCESLIRRKINELEEESEAKDD